jgi:hypothetical protein
MERVSVAPQYPISVLTKFNKYSREHDALRDKTAFKLWITWERSLRFKYSATAVILGSGVSVPLCGFIAGSLP